MECVLFLKKTIFYSINPLITILTMRKNLLFAALAFGLCFSACSSDDPVVPKEPIPATELQLSPLEAEIEVGDLLEMQCTVLPEDADDKTITWSSSNTEVATVSEEGVVTALKRGRTTITAQLGELTQHCELAVWNAADVVLESTFLDIRYWGDYYNTGLDNFTVNFGTVQQAGMIVQSPGEYFQFSMNTAPFKNVSAAYLLPGVYTFDSEGLYQEMTILGGTESRKILYEADANGDGAMEETTNYFQDAYMEIEYNEEEEVCIATAEVTLDTGVTIRVHYRGLVAFTNTIEYLIPKQSSEDLDFVCEYGSAKHKGEGKYSIDLQENGTDWADIQVVTLNLYTEANDTKIKAGSYPISAEPVEGGYVEAGGYKIMSGMSACEGSYCYVLSSTDWSMTYAFFNEGTLTISYEGENDSTMKVELESTDLNGHRVHMTYSGAPLL